MCTDQTQSRVLPSAKLVGSTITTFLVALLIVAIIGQLDVAEASPRDDCKSMSKWLEENVDSKKNEEEHFFAAEEKLFLASPDKRRVVENWSQLKKMRCDKGSFEAFNYVYACSLSFAPNPTDRIDTVLRPAIWDFIETCTNAPIMDGMYQRALLRLNAHQGGMLFKFLDERFISYYKELNPDEVLQMGPDRDFQCCRANAAVEMSAEALIRVANSEGAQTVAEYEGILAKYVIAPCQQFKSSLDLNGFSDLVEKILRFTDPEEFFEQQTKALRDGVFRYQFCLSLVGQSAEFMKTVIQEAMESKQTQ